MANTFKDKNPDTAKKMKSSGKGMLKKMSATKKMSKAGASGMKNTAKPY